MRIWLDYRGGTVENGQRLWFIANNFDTCWRTVKRIGNKVIPFGPGYESCFSIVLTVLETEFAEWDSRWLKRNDIHN